MSGLRRFRATFDVAARNFVDACGQARDLVKSGVGLTVREVQHPAPSAGGMLAVGTMRWTVTVPAMLSGEPCELMLAFDPARRRGVVLLMTVGPGLDDATLGTPVHLAPQALSDLRKAIELWPEDIIARQVTEDVLCPRAPAPAGSDD